MAKKARTKAQRRAAAILAWQRRRLGAAAKPTSTKAASASELPDVGWVPTKVAPTSATLPSTVGATQEGEDYFVTFSHNGSLFRHRLSESAMRKLGLDCLTLVG